MTDCQQHLSLTMKAEDAADKTKKCDYLFCTENMIWIFDLSHLLLDLSQGLQAKTKDKTIRDVHERLLGGGTSMMTSTLSFNFIIFPPSMPLRPFSLSHSCCSPLHIAMRL